VVGGVAADDLGAGEIAATAAVDGEDIVASSNELFDEGLADLAGSEDDVAAHEGLPCLLAWRIWRKTGSTAVSRATVTAPAAPKTVNCSSTWTPTNVLTAQPAAQAPAR
jgi:hypothetical protein